MPTFVAISDHFSPTATEKLKSQFPDSRQIAHNAWVIRADMGSQEISQLLFPSDEPAKAQRNVVLRFDAYWGVHDRSLWEWLSKKDS